MGRTVLGLILGKRELIARMCAGAGLTRILECMPKRRVLMILNYHRIGNAAETPYDSGTFSATADEFDGQIAYLKRHFHMATLDEVLAMVRGEMTLDAAVLITFDDGYLDNYTLAFPILSSHRVQGVFFLPTSFVGTGRLPWWDAIAYTVKHSRRRVIRLAYPAPATFDLQQEGVGNAIMRVLWLFKQPSMRDAVRFRAELEAACDASCPEDTERCFLNWDEARQMMGAGMAFGSHTHTHPILAKLSREQQQDEVSRSRAILERELGTRIDVLAYPVGAPHTFSTDTVHALTHTGYQAAFSFYGGINIAGGIQRFNVRRCGVDGQSFERLRLQTALGALTGTGWF